MGSHESGNTLLVAFGTDDEETLNDDHVGMARYFHVHAFSGGRNELVERRENVKLAGDESIKHGDPEKAKATSAVLKGIDVLVGKRFGPNLPRLLKKLVCVVIKMENLGAAIEAVHNNMDKIVAEKLNGQDRKHIVLRQSGTTS